VSTIKVDTVQSTGGGAVTLTKLEAAKILISYKGDGSALDAESFNITSLTDNANGDDSVSHTSNMNTVNYIFAGSHFYTLGSSGGGTYTLNTKEDTTRSNGYRSTSSQRLQHAYTNASSHFVVGDYGSTSGECTAVCFGDLA
jgi:hypothetical protein